ncbi:MAG: hypothetical protein ABFD52_09300 [Acidobacteriota bacterium]
MNYWKSLGKFLWKTLAGMLVILGVFQWGVKLKVATWVIPDWIILVILAFTLAVVGFTAYFVAHSPKVGTVKKPKEPEISLNEDECFVIVALSLNKDRNIMRDSLRKLFMEKLKGKNDLDFNIVLNKLHQLKFVDFTKTYMGEYVSILPRGLEHCEKIRDASKK